MALNGTLITWNYVFVEWLLEVRLNKISRCLYEGKENEFKYRLRIAAFHCVIAFCETDAIQ